MNDEKNDIDKFNIVKHIGKGSFSNVYLCKKELDLLSEDTEYYIIKEININVLVNKYMSKSKSEYKFNKMPQRRGNSNVSVNITPYNNTTNIMIPSKSTERDYYYYKLKGLIESEIDMLYVLNHPSIIKFNNFMNSNYIYYLNIEYCDKGDVYNILKNDNKEITTSFIYEFTKQTSNALTYMHKNNIIHRDIKLQNILVKTNDNKTEMNNFKYIFKISDFGFSCYDMYSLKRKNEIYDLDEMLCKKYYKLCGTPYFMAPEIISNMNKLENFTFYDENKKIKLTEFYDNRIDVWSYGISLYELITNRMPFSDIKSFKDLEKLYRREDIQFYIDEKLELITDDTFSPILYMALKINPKTRCYIDDINTRINEINNIKNIEINKNTQKESDNNSFLSMLKHIVSNPIDTLNNTFSSLNNGSSASNLNNTSNNIFIQNNVQDIQNNVSNKNDLHLDKSWEKINNSSSLMMKLSVQNGFLEWLMKK